MDARRKRIAVPLTAEAQQQLTTLTRDGRSRASVAESALQLGLRAMSLPPTAGDTTLLLAALSPILRDAIVFAQQWGLVADPTAESPPTDPTPSSPIDREVDALLGSLDVAHREPIAEDDFETFLGDAQ